MHPYSIHYTILLNSLSVAYSSRCNALNTITAHKHIKQPLHTLQRLMHSNLIALCFTGLALGFAALPLLLVVSLLCSIPLVAYFDCYIEAHHNHLSCYTSHLL